MKKVFYDSWIANKLLFKGYSTITIFAWVFTKYKEGEMKQRTINHECVHVRQWVELTISSGFALFLGMLIFGFSPWWLLISTLVFYAWYVLEYLIRRFLVLFSSNEHKQSMAYRSVAFEKEARQAEFDSNYLENSLYFNWFNYYR